MSNKAKALSELVPYDQLPPSVQELIVHLEYKKDSYRYGWGTLISGYACEFSDGSCHEQLVDQGESAFYIWDNTDGNSWRASGQVLCYECAANKYGVLEPGLFGLSGVDMGKLAMCYGCEEALCNTCQKCHNDSCVYVEKKVSTPAEIAKYAHLSCQTQKAKGYGVIANAGFSVPSPYAIMRDEKTIKALVPKFAGRGTMFVRPCPTRPRHGFVESVPIEMGPNTEQQLLDLLMKARAADEMGTAELLLVPLVDAECNLIVTPTRVAIGPGHDGATGGHGSISIPLMGVRFPDLKDSVIKDAGIGETEDPYVEVVIPKDGKQIFYTQLRAGAKIPPNVGADYIPKAFRVEEVIEASGDLLEWEKQQKQIKPHTVVVHVGGTLISHYGVHCITNGVAVMTSRKPEVGEILEPMGKVVEPSVEAVIRGLGDGVSMQLDLMSDSPDLMAKDAASMSVRNALRMMMSMLHNAPALGGEDAYWLGASTAIMIRCGMAASHGEARHKITGMASYRATVHRLSFADFFGSLETLGAAQWMFTKLKWSGSYGGPKWADCTDSIIKLEKIAREVMNGGGVDAVKRMTTQLNEAVNKAHNGGWWMNKFIDQSSFQSASQQDMKAVVYSAVGAFRMHRAALGVKGVEAIDKWRTFNDVEVKEGKLHPQTHKDFASKKADYGNTSASSSGGGSTSTPSLYTVAPNEEYPCTCDDCLKAAGVLTYYASDSTTAEQYKAIQAACGDACMHKMITKQAVPTESGLIASDTFLKAPDEYVLGKVGATPTQIIWAEAGVGYFVSCTKNKVLESPLVDVDNTPLSLDQINEAAQKLQKVVDMSKASDAKATKLEAKAKLADEPEVIQKKPKVMTVDVAGKTNKSELLEVQCNIHKKGTPSAYLHWQAKVVGSSNPYQSGNQPLPKVIGKYPSSGFTLSWAGSGTNNYFPMEFLKLDDGTYAIYHQGMKVGFKYNASTNGAGVMSWEDISGEITKAQTLSAVVADTANTKGLESQSGI